MNVVFDTNVYLSALVFPGGTCDRILRFARSEQMNVFVSPDILTEIKEVLTKKFKFTEDESEELIERVLAIAELVYPRFRVDRIKKMERDNRILECADEAKANYLVTGDKKHILPLKKHGDTHILSPAQFIDFMISSRFFQA